MNEIKHDMKNLLKQLKYYKDIPVMALSEIKILNDYINTCMENINDAKIMLDRVKQREQISMKAFNEITDAFKILTPLEQEIIELRYIKCYSWDKMEFILHYNVRTLQLYHSDILLKLDSYYKGKNCPP